jgi:hypothetical protein
MLDVVLQGLLLTRSTGKELAKAGRVGRTIANFLNFLSFPIHIPNFQHFVYVVHSSFLFSYL